MYIAPDIRCIARRRGMPAKLKRYSISLFALPAFPLAISTFRAVYSFPSSPFSLSLSLSLLLSPDSRKPRSRSVPEDLHSFFRWPLLRSVPPNAFLRQTADYRFRGIRKSVRVCSSNPSTPLALPRKPKRVGQRFDAETHHLGG